MTNDLVKIYDQLIERCEAEGFAGYDPFDGPESKLFQATPFSRIASARFVWLQIVKRSPINLRPLLRVPKGVNSKGLALFALAELSRHRENGNVVHRENVNALLMKLREGAIRSRLENGSDSCAFGYNFDWQSRAFFAPKGTPTIVPTAFAGRAFIEAYANFGDAEDLETASEICEFIVKDLQRPHETDDEICFSYTPLDSSLIYNASLLAGETLAVVGAKAGNDEYSKTAAKAARYVIRNQSDNGSWRYGPKSLHAWIDNFHTAFILSSLMRIAGYVPEIRDECHGAVEKGFKYWIANFFHVDGTPKYFDSRVFPVDIHSAAAAIVTLSELAEIDERALPLAEKVAEWTFENLLGPDGLFYYQKRRLVTVKTPFMRWGQAWMAYALAKLIEAKRK